MIRLLRVAALTAALGLSSAAYGQPNLEQAKTFFDLGAKAYDAQQYLAAIGAFEKAYALAPREGLLFSIAQSYRRQYYTDPQPAYLRVAIEKYREYLERVGSGGRAADARQALAELEPMFAKLTPEQAAAPLPGAEQDIARVIVSTNIREANFSFDGGKPEVDKTFFKDVKPGTTHRIKVSAAGYFDQEIEVEAREKGETVPYAVTLQPKPARLNVQADDGAEVAVNGRVVGETPLPVPIELRAGSHYVTVALNGHDAHAEELQLERGEKRDLQVDLPTTPQRYAAYVMITTGVAAAAGGAVFTGLAFSSQSKAQDIYDKKETQNITSDELLEYNDLVTERDELRRVAGILYGAGALVGGIGLLLYLFDEPSLDAPASRLSGDEQPEEEGGEAGPSADIAVAAAWVPGGAAGVVTGRF
jgi:hypothetical protein